MHFLINRAVLFVSIMCFFCASSLAATIDMIDNGDGTCTITVTAEGAVNIVGLGLDIDVQSGGNITAATVDTATFNIFLDTAHDLEVTAPGSYTYGAGTCIANQDAVGEAAISNSFCISAAALNGEATAGATGSAYVEIIVTFDADSTICVKKNALRGGIILADGTGEGISNGTAGVVCSTVIPPPVCDCYQWSIPGDYEEAVAVGCPDSWCYQYQCRGDADGQNEPIGKGFFAVGFNDIDILLEGFNAPYGGDPLIDPWIAADFDHRAEPIGKGFFRVGFNDINILLQYFNNPVVPNCYP